ncbi:MULTISPECIES: sulfatase-like hydrolase/transferase [unclassified Ruegeria]|uniref:sulfatase-like hydrolase/transferase n=1 Tax=unclassified Ruegeria TaxID=2625375 RepID=UPI001ADB9E98|nr:MULTISPECIES: sulfatase-like hydrolase/transferase [unclassified Ruegeria]MBO9411749.1 sulfatase-like hydrolase/transferase [Ruegeria sp. R8_1]MBO9415689.1 sulfatase-like hydrolase/transferase [Ruegeria sp. R8_2]
MKSLLQYASVMVLMAGASLAQDTPPIIHDGEFQFLRAQFGEEWDAQDAEIEAKLAEIREAKGGQPPNFLYILIDDVSFGQMGNRTMNYVTGFDTPNINDFATEGMSLMRMYTEPSCTPTRTAMLTGRHPVRAGVEEVKVALVGEGLAAEEVTIAEILKEKGYNTSHVGKWHQGDIEEAYPHNQGFDWAAFPLHQQVQLSLMTRDAMVANNMLGFHPSGQSNQFQLDQRFKPYGLVTGVEGQAGGIAREVDMAPGEEWTQAKYEEMNLRYQRQALEQLEQLAAQDSPFFMQYWPLYPLNFAYPDQAVSRNGGFHADKLQVLDGWIGEVLDKLDETGEADNTVVMIMADNGLMYHYEGTSGLNQLIYRGGKTQHLEGGVRTDAFIRWPGAIKPGSAAGDIVHVSDLFTTFARIAGATDQIPRDRVIDGIDQTALLLEGEGNSRRDYVYVYEGPVLRSVVKQEFKMHLAAPGQPGAAAPVFNVYRDPREEHPLVGYSLWSGASFQDMVKRHQKTIAEHPHLPLGKGIPYEGIENLRPESELTREIFASWQ